MSNKFITEVDLQFTSTGLDEITKQAQAALTKIASGVGEAASSGGSTRGAISDVEAVRRGALTAARGAGATPEQIRSLQRTLQSLEQTIRSLLGGRGAAGGSGSTPADEARRRSEERRNEQRRQRDQQRQRPTEAQGSLFSQEEVIAATEARRKAADRANALRRSPEYLRANTDAATQNALFSSAKNQSLNNPETNSAVVAAEASSKELAAALDQARAGSDEYKEAIVKAATAASTVSAAISEEKAASEEYNQALTLAATAAKQEAAAATEDLAGSADYREAFVKAAVAANLLAGSLDEEKATNEDYKASFTLAATAAKQQAAAMDGALAGDQIYREATTKAAAAAQELAASLSEDRAGSAEFSKSLTRAAIAAKEEAAATDDALAGSRAYVEGVTKAAEQANLLAAVIAEERAASDDYNTALTLAATATKAEAAAADEALATDKDYLEATGAAAVAKKRLAASEELAAQANEQYKQAIQDSVTATKARAAREAEAGATQDNINSDAQKEIAQRRQRLGVQQKVQGLTTPQDVKNTGEQQAAEARQKVAIQLEALAARLPEDVAAEAQLIALKRKQAEELAIQVDQALGRRAGPFQTLQHAFRGGNGGGGGGGGGGSSAAGEQSFGQFIGSHATRTLGYAIPGIAIGVGFEELSNVLKESEQAQRSLALLSSQFQTLGQGSQLAGYNQQIKEISSNTGIAVSEIAELALTMKGVYGDTSQAEIALRGAAEAATAFGLSATEAGQDTVALTQSFPELQVQGGKATTTVANEVANAQNKFGVPAGQVLSGAADLAPVAAQLGLTSNQTVALVAGTAQRSGVPVDEVSQNLSRILPQFADSLPQIIQYYKQIPQLQGHSQALIGDVARGNNGGAFLQFIQDFKNIPAGIQDTIAETLGDTRYAPQLLAASENGARIAQVGNGPVPADAASNAYKAAEKTLQVQLDQIRNDFINLGTELLNSGIGTGIEEFLGFLGDLAKGFTAINQATHGGVGDALLAVTGGLLALKAALAIGSGIRTMAEQLGILGDTSVTTTGKLEAETIANTTLGTDAAVTAGKLDVEGASEAIAGGGATAGAAEKTGAEAVVGGEAAAGGGLGLPIVAGLAGAAALNAGVEAFGASRFGPTGGKNPTEEIQKTYNAVVTKQPTGGSTPSTQPVFVNGQWVVPANRNTASFTAQGTHAQPGLDTTKSVGYQSVGDLPTVGKSQDLPEPAALQTALAKAVANQRAEAAALKNVAQAQSGIPTLAQELAAGVHNELNTYQDLQSYYQAGQVSFSQYVSALQQNISSLATTVASPKATQTDVDNLSQAQATLTQSLDQQAQLLQQANVSTLPQGAPSTDVATLQSLANLVGTQKGPQDVISTGTQAIQDIFTGMSDAASAAQTGAQKVAASTQTVAIPAGVIQAFKNLKIPIANSVTGYLSATQTFQDLSQDITAQGALAQAGAHEDPLAQAQATLTTALQSRAAVLKSGEGTNSTDYQNAQAQVVSASQQVVDQQHAITAAQIGLAKANATASGDILGEARADQQAAVEAFASAHGTAAQLQAQAQLVAANYEAVQAIYQISSAQTNLQKAYDTAAGNVVAQAEDDQQLAREALTAARGPVATLQAQAQLVAANYEVVQAVYQTASAQTNLVKAYDTAGGDVLAEAKADQQLASEAITAARGKVATLQAEAQQVAANREVVTAINEIASAQAGLLTAMAQATGNPQQVIAAARNAAAVDLANVNRIKAADEAIGKNPKTDQAYVAALTQYYNDQSTAANTIAQQTIDTTETLLFLGKETATTAIANLEAALPQVKGNVTATNQILTEIRQIQNSASSQLNFDLPTDLLTQPSLYQARRVAELRGAAYNVGNGLPSQSGQVQVTINVNNPSQTPGAVSKLVQAIGGPAVYGTGIT